MQGEMAVLCGGEVSLSSDSWGEEGQSFPARLVLTNLTTATTFSLVPLWDRLVISPAQVLVSPGQAESSTLIGPDLTSYCALIGGTLLC